MRPVRVIDPEFFAPDEALSDSVPLLDLWMQAQKGAQPLAGTTVLLIQHQLSNQVPMLKALLDLGVRSEDVWWLDIPYTSHPAVRDYAAGQFGVPRSQLLQADYPVLAPYGPYQHARAIRTLRTITDRNPGSLIVLDDGAYALEALAALSPARWPQQVAIVEQTTRGFIKWAHSAALRSVAAKIPVIDVARSEPKRTLEPPFIGMAICAALAPHLERHARSGPVDEALVLGYGAVGEQVASFLREQLHLPGSRISISDPAQVNQEKAARRGFSLWDRDVLQARFSLVVGCSGQASFSVGDGVYLRDAALLASASSGSVELSRQDFIELADASDADDLWIRRDGLDLRDIHAPLTLHLVDREVTFVNAGFPVNFDGRLTVCPSRYIQPTPTMMVAATVQAAAALRADARGVQELDGSFCTWVDREFRALLGERAEWLLPVPEAAW
ncbi:MAG: hypothetical protein ACHQD6_10030 [Steroidobacterales bacterium]|jgi:S-adenosylhomocysteine hydrolase